MRIPFIPVLAVAGTLTFGGCAHRPTEAGWEPLFDGRTLAGWTAPDMSYWRVEDGALTGETTRDHNPPRTQFIVREGDASDFELKFEVRIFGEGSNSGMQFRSVVKELGLVHGYQADLDGAARYFGGIWDEYSPRNSLAARGESTEIAEDGTRKVTGLPGGRDILKGIDLSQWNEYHITAVGPEITLRVNGVVTARLVDRERGRAAASGVFATAIIPGAPMKVQFRHLRLKRYR